MIVIENAIDTRLLETVSDLFPSEDWEGWHHYSDKDAEKFGSKPKVSLPECVITALNSVYLQAAPYVNRGCFPDFELHGAGLHKLEPGGYLRPHIDSSIHPKTGWKREYSCVLFCNKNWERKDGGCFGISNDIGEHLPTWNKLILFRTTEESVHWVSKITGNESRKSLALFFWSHEEPIDPTRDKAKFL